MFTFISLVCVGVGGRRGCTCVTVIYCSSIKSVKCVLGRVHNNKNKVLPYTVHDIRH